MESQSFKLSIDTEKRFNQLEKIIEKGMVHFIDVGTALSIIRDEKLYKDTFRTFEEYCKERWGFSRPRAYQLIDAARVNQNLSTIVDKPKNESQTRPLTHLPPEQQREAWKKAVETAPEGKITAKHIEGMVYKMEGNETEEPEEVEDTEVIEKLKQYWRIATKYEKEIFIKWLEGE